MNNRELQRFHLLQSVLDGKVTLTAAATALGLSLRQARRLKGKVAAGGATGVIHGNRGRAPAHVVSAELRENVLRLSREKYAKVNDTHFTEMLAEQENIALSRATVARIRRDAGV